MVWVLPEPPFPVDRLCALSPIDVLHEFDGPLIFTALSPEGRQRLVDASFNVDPSPEAGGFTRFLLSPSSNLRHAIDTLRSLANLSTIDTLTEVGVCIDQVRALGVRIALDDFGAAASSFGYVKNLNVDLLKIDGQFSRDLLDDPSRRCGRALVR